MSLLWLLIAAMNSVFVLENPASSLMFEYKLVKHAIRCLRTAGIKARKKTVQKGRAR